MNRHNNWYLIKKAKRRTIPEEAEFPLEQGETLLKKNLGTRYYARGKAPVPEERTNEGREVSVQADVSDDCTLYKHEN